MSDLWLFLSDPNNQKTLAWLGSGVSVAAAALWVAITFFAQRKSAEPSAETPSARGATAEAGSVPGSNLHIGRDVRIEQGKLPRGALILMAFGLVVLLYAVLTSRGDISVTGGSYVGGDVEKSRIDVDALPVAKP